MKNLFFGALALSLFSFTTVDKFESYDYGCDGENQYLIEWSCGGVNCVAFPVEWNNTQIAKWWRSADDIRCAEPNTTITPA